MIRHFNVYVVVSRLLVFSINGVHVAIACCTVLLFLHPIGCRAGAKRAENPMRRWQTGEERFGAGDGSLPFCWSLSICGNNGVFFEVDCVKRTRCRE